jgi:site-specific recombinase XerD
MWIAIYKEENELIVRGKGNKQRAVPLGNAAPALEDWLLIRGRADGPLAQHDFRRTFVGDLMDAGADIVTVQKMAGHADPAMTSRCNRRDRRDRHKAGALP